MPCPELLSSEWDSLIFSPATISTTNNERDLNMSSDQSEVYFTRGTTDNTRRTLMRAIFDQEQCIKLEILPFSGVYNDIEAFLSPEGQKLFFASNRPLPGESEAGDYNIWFVSKTGAGWGEAVPVSELINTDADEFYPSIANSGNLYFTAAYQSGLGLEDIYMSKWNGKSYETPVVLDSFVNSGAYEFNAYISPDELQILYSSYGRPDGLGGGDIYMNTRNNKEDNWSAALHLPAPINSYSLDYCPFVDSHKTFLYFTSNRQLALPDSLTDPSVWPAFQNNILNGSGNIFRVPLSSIIQ